MGAATLTISAIDQSMEEAASKEASRYHLGYSLIGEECTRKLWYTFRWADSTKHPGRLLRLFARGQNEEASFVHYLKRAGVTVWDEDPETGQQFQVSPEECGGHFGGSLDGVGMGFREDPGAAMVIEMKTSADKPFKDLVKNGVKISKPQHWAQMAGYMHQMGLPKAFYIAVNKNNDEFYSEIVEADDQFAESLIARAKHVITSDRPLAKMSEDPSFYKCKWCDFNDVCHNIKTPRMNCRTCIHSTAELDGTARWSCAKHDKGLNGQDQLIGCDDHLFIPDLLANFATVVEYSESDGTVIYENRLNGHRFFTNGTKPGNYLSREIAAAADAKVLGDELADTFKEKFQAEVIA